MTTDDIAIRRLDADDALRAIPALASLLMDCVEGGASVSFMHPLSRARAESFWRGIADGVAQGERALVVAEDASGGVLGTVQLVLAQPENQAHRADLAKMLVHRSARRRGLAGRLLAEAERIALEAGRTLLVLDTVTGSDAERLYLRSGWRRVGEIPGYARMPDGPLVSTTIFYKELGD